MEKNGDVASVHNNALWKRGSFANAAMKDSRFNHEGAFSHFTVPSRLGLHRSKHQLLNAGRANLSHFKRDNWPHLARVPPRGLAY